MKLHRCLGEVKMNVNYKFEDWCVQLMNTKYKYSDDCLVVMGQNVNMLMGICGCSHHKMISILSLNLSGQ